MIHIDRPPIPPQLVVYTKLAKLRNGGECTKAEREKRNALAFFTGRNNYRREKKLTKKAFHFAVYSDREVRKALEAIFNGKCAYCESSCRHVSPSDIEHFRPKSEIETGTGVLRPGYYWLATEWSNLLVSCIDCNRKRLHDVPGQAKQVRLGKLTQFPLTSEKFRVRSGSVAREEAARLLLDPCSTDDPDQHLRFDDNGLVHPRVKKKVRSRMGEVSITVYALQRKGLVEARLEVLDLCKSRFKELIFYVTNHNELCRLKASRGAIAANAEQIADVKNALSKMLQPNAVYLGMLRRWIRDSARRGDFALLFQFGIDPEKLIPGG